MSYDIDFRVRVENTGIFASIYDCSANTTWNLRKMIRESTGLEWKNEEDNGLVLDVIPAIQHGLSELKMHPMKYKQYESPNGWGTLAGCENFFETILEDWKNCQMYIPDAMIPYVHFWIC